MPITVLKSQKHGCPTCNPEKNTKGVMLFISDLGYLYCINCNTEFNLTNLENEELKAIEKEPVEDIIETNAENQEEKPIVENQAEPIIEVGNSEENVNNETTSETILD